MITVRARVRNGRLLVDEPTDMPEGTEIDLVAEGAVADDVVAARLRAAPPADERLSPDEASELERIGTQGRFVTHEELRRKVAARKT